MKYLFLSAIIIILIIALYFFTVLIIGYIYEYTPDKHIILNENKKEILDTDTLEIVSWNIGYAGLDEEMDFFFDGGKKMRTSNKKTLKNINNIISYILDKGQSTDIFLLQEVDRKAHRSYNINIFDSIVSLVNEFHSVYCQNYKAHYIPLPIFNPMRNVDAGLVNLTRPIPYISERYAFSSQYNMPTRLFMLKRCFLAQRFALKNGKDLLVLNIHLSAYDDGSLRLQQLNELRVFIESEYLKGNYVVVGGDWNQVPFNFTPQFKADMYDKKNQMSLDPNYMPEWQWVFDETTPTNRCLASSYQPKYSPTTVIDYFLVSPNIKVIDYGTCNLFFKYSDHNPVYIKVTLIKD